MKQIILILGFLIGISGFAQDNLQIDYINSEEIIDLFSLF